MSIMEEDNIDQPHFAQKNSRFADTYEREYLNSSTLRKRNPNYEEPRRTDFQHEEGETSKCDDQELQGNTIKSPLKRCAENDEHDTKVTNQRPTDNNFSTVKVKAECVQNQIKTVDVINEKTQNVCQNQSGHFVGRNGKNPVENSLEDDENYPEKHVEEKTIQAENLGKYSQDDGIPEALDEEPAPVWPPTCEQQIDEKQLTKILNDSSKEEATKDTVEAGDVIEMDGKIPVYYHYIVVIYKSDDGVVAAELTLRQASWPKLFFLFLIFGIVFLDPLAKLAEVQTSKYTFDYLKNRNAKKIRFSRETKKYIDNHKTEEIIKKRKGEPAKWYSLGCWNCEHFVYECVFGLPVSFQLQKLRTRVFIKDCVYCIFAAVHLVVFFWLASYLLVGISWEHSCFFHEIYLSCYQTWKLHEFRKQEKTSEKKKEEEEYSVWIKTLITLGFTLIGGLAMKLEGPPGLQFFLIVIGNIIGLFHKSFFNDSWFLKGWLMVVVLLNPFGMVSVMARYIIASLLGWLLKCAIVCIIFKTIILYIFH